MEGFTIVPNEILEKDELSISERMILIALISYKNEKLGFAYPSYKQLMKRSGVKKDTTLTKGINKLIELGLIKKDVIKGKGCKYFLQLNTSCKRGITPTIKIEDVTPKNGVTPTAKVEYDNHQKWGTTNNNTNTKTKYINLAFIDSAIDKVYITKDEYRELVEKYNERLVNQKIIDLDGYITSGRGKNYGSHFKVLNTWINRDIAKNPSLNNKKIIVNEKIREVFV